MMVCRRFRGAVGWRAGSLHSRSTSVHLGGSGGEPRQVVDTDRQQANFGRPCRSLEGSRVSTLMPWLCSGLSSGGGLAIGARGCWPVRIAAVIALCPATDTIAFLRRMPMRTLNAVNVAICATCWADDGFTFRLRRARFHSLWSASPRRSPVSTPSVAITPSGATTCHFRLRGPSASDRFGSPAVCFAPCSSISARRITWSRRGAAERTVERAPRGERGLYPIDHFSGFLGENFERRGRPDRVPLTPPTHCANTRPARKQLNPPARHRESERSTAAAALS